MSFVPATRPATPVIAAQSHSTCASSLITGRTIWISDLHLGFRDCQAEYLLNFLNDISCDTLYLIGDIVDMWSLKKRFHWPTGHYKVLLKLYDLANNGTRVIYVPGNHDEPMRRFHGSLFGPIEIAGEHVYTTADGKKLLIMHGDAMDAYINLSFITRFCGSIAYSGLLFINRWNNRFRKLMCRPYFSLAALIKNSIRHAKAAIETYQAEAMEEAARRKLDGVVCGHIHSAALFEHGGVRYCNTGDWIESCTAIIEDHQGHMRLLHYSDQVRWQEDAWETATSAAAC